MEESKGFASLKLHLLKVFSLLCAFLIWFYVLNSESLTVHIKLPLSINVNSGVAVGSQPPREIDVLIKGPRVFIRNLESQRLTIYLKTKVNVAELPVVRTLHIKESDISLPLGISVSKISPRKIKVRFEKQIKKFIPIIPNFVNQIDNRYRLIKKHFLTEKVLIEGPIETLRKITKIYTEPIDLSMLQGSGLLTVKLQKLNDRVKVDRKLIKFQYIAKPKSANLLLKKIRIRFVSSFHYIFSKQKYASISVLADKGDDDIITKKDVQVIADIPDGRAGVYTVKLQAKLPPSLHLLEIMPAKIRVRVR